MADCSEKDEEPAARPKAVAGSDCLDCFGRSSVMTYRANLPMKEVRERSIRDS